MEGLEEQLGEAASTGEELAETRRSLAASTAELMTLRVEHDRIQTEVTRMREDITLLTAEKTRQELNIRNLERENGRLSRELDEAREEVAARIDADTRVREFEARLSGIEQMKRLYEQRLKHLKDEVRALRKAAGENAGADELGEIDMRSDITGDENLKTGSIPVVPTNKQKSRRREADGTDWLLTLPD